MGQSQQASAALLAHQELCAPVGARIQRAVRHERGGSPFRLGVGRWDSEEGLVSESVHAAAVLAAQARNLFLSGRAEDAFQLLLDGYRFHQDAAKGSSLLGYVAEVAST